MMKKKKPKLHKGEKDKKDALKLRADLSKKTHHSSAAEFEMLYDAYIQMVARA